MQIDRMYADGETLGDFFHIANLDRDHLARRDTEISERLAQRTWTSLSAIQEFLDNVSGLGRHSLTNGFFATTFANED